MQIRTNPPRPCPADSMGLRGKLVWRGLPATTGAADAFPARGSVFACSESSPSAPPPASGSSEFRVWVKHRGRSAQIEVRNETSVAELKRAACVRHSIPEKSLSVLRLRLGRTIIQDEDTTIGELRAGKDVEFEILAPMAAFPAGYEPAVQAVLKSDLEQIQAHPRGLFVFIGIGSHHSGKSKKEDETTIRRQQCPEKIYQFCQNNGLRLVILLVDIGYRDETVGTQVYDLDPERWRNAGTTPAGVRRYHDHAGHDMWVYPTNVLSAEYDGTQKTLADVDLVRLGAHLGSASSYLLAGNFYESATPPHVAHGPGEGLSQLGYRSLESAASTSTST